MKQEKLKNIYLTYQCGVKDSEFGSIDGKPFCNQCKTVVHDLTQSDNHQVQSLFNGKETICGSFYNDQLETPYHIPKNTHSKKFLLSSALGALTLFVLPKTIVAQMPNVEQTEFTNDSTYKGDLVNYEPTKEIVEIIEDDEPAKYRKGRVDLFRIQRRHFYLNSRFPFVHAKRRRMLRGKVGYHDTKSVRHL